MLALVLIETLAALAVLLIAHNLGAHPAKGIVLATPAAAMLAALAWVASFAVAPASGDPRPAWTIYVLWALAASAPVISLATIVAVRGFRLLATLFALLQTLLAALLALLGTMQMTGLWI
ncbi:hypothetical protein [Caulobacter hibisci]|uniref:DUF3147 family protein n=1 Tax=Caulobacter hibisci TaxID=2035993 RepID=A0ABS0SVF1_9CAUL|nr:hypothetical protein [Caulobacter hibisci]MBI1683591.1 hypothetical protein [Caulobacter hibisci]